MATFKPVVRKKRADGTYLVFIRCTHDRKVTHFKTDMYAVEKDIKNGEIINQDILAKCLLKISEYRKSLNLYEDEFTVGDIGEIINPQKRKIPFEPFADEYILKMRSDGRKKPADNYQCALNSFIKYAGCIAFQDITSKIVGSWIESIKHTKRAKEAYPTWIRAIFDSGCLKYNDYDRGILKIKNNPFKIVKIPKSEVANKRAINVETLKKILDANTQKEGRMVLAKDVAMIVFFLAGINTVDLYNIKKSDRINNKICYEREKEKKARDDKAYIEISIPDEIMPLIEKYNSPNAHLFDFSSRYMDSDSFNKAINIGLRALCDILEIPPVSSYSFRHTWATIAQNNCGASTELVAFCLNHASAHKVTERYIKKDFSPIDILNRKVIDFVLNFCQTEDI